MNAITYHLTSCENEDVHLEDGQVVDGKVPILSIQCNGVAGQVQDDQAWQLNQRQRLSRSCQAVVRRKQAVQAVRQT